MAMQMLLVCRVALTVALAAEAVGAGVSPVGRVVKLMQDLTKKIEADGKAEEDLFENYVCWHKTVTSTKKEANSQASDRIKSLQSYVNGVFASENKEEEEEVKKLGEEIATQRELRKRDEADFEAAKEEMEHAITSLEKAVEVLGGASPSTALPSVGFDLRRVLELGRNSLKKQDAKALEEALDDRRTEDKQPTTKAQKAAEQKARTETMRTILSDMLLTFKDNLADANTKETETKASNEKLLTQKESELAEANEALAAGTMEEDAHGLAVAQAKEEITKLEGQVTTDQGYIADAEAAHAAMLAEWKERKRLRADEVAAIGKAIEVLNSDEARDVLTASFKSQTAFFLQGSGAASCLISRSKKASQTLRKLAEKTGSSRLAMLAVDVRFRGRSGRKGAADAIVTGIEKILSDLHTESDMDLKIKEDCEDDRNRNTKMAKNSAYEIDTQTALIVRKESEIDAKQGEIKRLQDEKSELGLQREEAQVARTKAKLQQASDKAGDEAALKLIGKAKGVLDQFYTDNKVALAQGAALQQPVVEAGLAPPPPPSTWDAPYVPTKGETSGIQAILGMVEDDISKDIKVAEEAEKESIAEFEAFMASSTTTIEGIDSDVALLEGIIAEAEGKMKDARGERKDRKKVMDSALMYLRSIATGCDFMAANFEYRKQMREEEVDGLLEAETMLTGGETGAFKPELLQDASASC